MVLVDTRAHGRPGGRLATLLTLFSVLCIAVLGPAGPAAAQGEQHEPLLSERAFGLGGAVVGSAAGPSAAFYNPAGVADTPGTSAGATLSLQSYRSYTVTDAYQSVLGAADLSDSGLLSIPIFIGAVLKFGPRDATNIRQHGLAAGMIIRNSLNRELLNRDSDLSNPMAVRASSLWVQDREETRWFYLSYAFRPSNQLSFGLTAAVANYSRAYREFWSQASDISGGFMGTGTGFLSSRESRVDLNQTSLVFRLGGSFRPSEWIQLAIMIQIPSIPLFHSGSAFFQRVTADSGAAPLPGRPAAGFFRSDMENLDVQAGEPWQLRVGSYARLDPRLGIGLDLGLTASQGSTNDPVHPLGVPMPVDEGRNGPAATYFADHWWSDYGFDVALGAEIMITEEIPLRIGAFYELSGLPVHVGAADTYLPDRLDRLGFTAAFGVQGDRYDFGIGVGYFYGYGTGFRPVDPFQGGYATTDVTSHELTIFLSGVTGAATQLALDTYRAITGSGFDEAAVVEDDALDHVEELRDPNEPPTPEEVDRAHQLQDLPSWVLEAMEEGEGAADEEPEIGDPSGRDLIDDLDTLQEETPEDGTPAPSPSPAP